MRTPSRPVILLAMVLLAGCSTTPAGGPYSQPQRQIDAVTDGNPPGADPIRVYDPFERTNRAVYKFNAQFDRYVYLPVVDAYRAVTPGFVRTGVGNFFRNLGEITTFTNAVLQAKVET